MAIILVTDAEQRSALATVRSLGRAGHRVSTASHEERPLAGVSRYVISSAVVPNPLEDQEAFARAVTDEVVRLGAEVLLPVTDASVLALLPHRERIPAILPLPSAEGFSKLCDKHLVAAEASAFGIRVPRTVLLRTRGDDRLLVNDSFRGPVVLKPTRTVEVDSRRIRRREVTYYDNRDALWSAVDRMPDDAFPLLLQERVLGPGVGIFVALHEGELIAAFAHRRIREKPPSGGVSVLRESIPMPSDLLDASVQLLRRFDFEGCAMVEYKIDTATNTPYILEINGRLWGSLQLAIDAGVDFPALMVAASLGHPLPDCPPYRVGIRSRWFWGDVDHLLLRLREPRSSRGVWNDFSLRWRAINDFILAFAPSVRSEVLQLSDPQPAMRETLNWLAKLARSKPMLSTR